MSRLDDALDAGCNWLVRHPWTACWLICAGWLIVALIEVPR